MSGGVDSSVAAALRVGAGHDVVGATLKLWGGPSDSGCCSVADVDDARRVAQQLGIAHHVFNMAEDFDLWAEKDGKKSAVKTVSSWDARKDFISDLKLK